MPFTRRSEPHGPGLFLDLERAAHSLAGLSNRPGERVPLASPRAEAWPPPAGQQLPPPERCGGSGQRARDAHLLRDDQFTVYCATCGTHLLRQRPSRYAPQHRSRPRLPNTSSNTRPQHGAASYTEQSQR
jgi:hypothetical protein